jgi:3-oxoacyl-[acyl-carrier protein] reductase
MSQKLLILGASSEMGLGLIQASDTLYDEIICHYHAHDDKLRDLQKSMKTPLITLQGDFSNEAGILGFVEKLSRIEAITHVVHCPSIPVDLKAFKKTKWDNTKQMIDVSVHSIYEILKVLLPSMMKAKRGKVVFILSSYTSGLAPAFMSDYITSKYALLGLMKALSSEMASHHVCINAVSPSLTETVFLQNIPALAVEMSAEKNPMKRNALVKDIVPMIKFLLSDESDFITGQNILVSGGEQ